MDKVTEASIKINEIASRLGLEAVTIRKCCLQLEKHGFLSFSVTKEITKSSQVRTYMHYPR